MIGERVLRMREERGLTQTELAKRAGVSRQLIGALEAGRHLPRVDAAMGIASALGADVSSLFDSGAGPQDVLTGQPPRERALVRAGQVGDQDVVVEAGPGRAGWDVADGLIEGGHLRPLRRSTPGVVMVGCEPGLEVLEGILRESGRGALAVTCSTAAAVAALEEGRAHAAVVHGGGQDRSPGDAVVRFHLCSWRVGLADAPDAAPGWAEEALVGQVDVVQREAGAGVQTAFEKVAGTGVRGPRARDHLEAARIAMITGTPAVTIEPAALALGALFHPLETHQAELWVSEQWVGDATVEAALNEITGRRFQSRLLGVGGYDLDGIGVRAA